jgi:hypothetical protein
MFNFRGAKKSRRSQSKLGKYENQIIEKAEKIIKCNQ